MFTYSAVKVSVSVGGAGIVMGGGGVELLDGGVSAVDPVPSSRRHMFGGWRWDGGSLFLS